MKYDPLQKMLHFHLIFTWMTEQFAMLYVANKKVISAEKGNK